MLLGFLLGVITTIATREIYEYRKRTADDRYRRWCDRQNAKDEKRRLRIIASGKKA